jgi:hypothetical protein
MQHGNIQITLSPQHIYLAHSPWLLSVAKLFLFYHTKSSFLLDWTISAVLSLQEKEWPLKYFMIFT